MTPRPCQRLLLFSCWVMSNSLQPHGLQHTRPPCPSLSPGVCSESYPSSRWCHPTIASSVALFSSCLQSFPASGYFSMSWLFASGGQSTGASASVLPINIQGWFPLGLTGLISLWSKWLSRVFSSITIWKHPFFSAQPKDCRQEEKGTTEDEMVGWHHWLNGHEFEQTLGDGKGTGTPGMLQSMGSQRVRHDWVTELNWTELNFWFLPHNFHVFVFFLWD